MTAQPTRDQLEAELDSWMTRAYEAEKRAWQAEHRITRLEAQTNIRGRAVVMYRERAREAEAQIKAALDMHEPRMAYRLIDGEDFAQEPDGHVCVVCREYYPCDTIRALEGMK